MDNRSQVTAQFSELSDADIPQACQLFQTVFGQSITSQQWLWKYQQGPRLGGLNCVARDANGQLIGHVGASIFPASCGNISLAMAQVCDVMVLPSARSTYSSQTVYPRLLRMLQSTLATRYHVGYAYGFAGLRQVKLGQRLGLYRALQAYRPVYINSNESRDWGHSLWRVSTEPWSLTRLNRIWQRHALQLASPTVCRTGQYLFWRYRDHPVHTYQLWVLTHLLRDRGWFITRALPNGETCVVDALLPAGADPEPILKVLASAIAKSRTAQSRVFTWMLQARENRGPDAVIACEVKLKQWQTSYPDPLFHPGDTDVF